MNDMSRRGERFIWKRLVLAGTTAVLSLSSLQSAGSPSKPRFAAEIRRTAHGIAHVKAADEAGIGYGMGYAYAQDNVCMLAEEMVTVRGERSRHFGPDAIGGPDFDSGSIASPNLQSDFFFKLVNDAEQVSKAWRQQSAPARALMEGYAAGFNRYLADTGRAALPVACRNAPWVRELDARDLIRFMRRLAVETSSLAFMQALVAAQPPRSPTAARVQATEPRSASVAAEDPLGPKAWNERRLRLGSNGVALGKQATENGRGLLLGNPHYPWHGSLRFHQQHLTIPGKLDVMGATLGGFPAILIGFNQHVAWTHTVNTSAHFTLYELHLDEADPMRYVVDGTVRKLIRKTVHVDVKQGDGTLRRVAHDFWVSDYGPLVHSPGRFEWTRTTAYALRDANFDNNRMLETWRALNGARSLTEMQSALTSKLGIPWVNTLAVDSDGSTLFADVTVVPNVSDAKLASCVSAAHGKHAADGMYVLDSRTGCEWSSDPGAPQAGVFSGQRLPQMRRDDFVQNSNDSAWLTNPAAPLTAFARIVSEQDYEQNERTRMGVDLILARMAGTDGLEGRRFNARNLEQMALSNRSYHGGLLHEDLRAICKDVSPVSLDGSSVDVGPACEAVGSWDGYANLESRGYPMARTWIQELLGLGAQIWRVPFSAQDPLRTPRDLDRDSPAVVQGAREALARTVVALKVKGIDAAQPWGQIQVLEIGGQRIPVHGGIGVYNAVVSAEAEGLARVRFGTSYIQVVGFDEKGPQARALLAYSQSTDPQSPYFADQTKLFSSRQWIVQPFTAAQIEAGAVGSRITLAE